MEIGVIGLGYVGLVTSICFASAGHKVVGLDTDKTKLKKLLNGELPLFENGLDRYFEKAKKLGNLEFTDDLNELIEKTHVCSICVGTPHNEDGSVNLDYIKDVTADIALSLKKTRQEERYTICVRSTIPPGTSEDVIIPIIEGVSGKKVGEEVGYAFNPEFLREGSAVADFFNPAKTIIGVLDDASARTVMNLFRDFPGEKFVVRPVEAELSKYVDNIWHAIKVSFANEVGYFAKKHGADGRLVMDMFVKDTKLNISPVYLKPGFAFGGSCLPKDLKGFIWEANRRRIEVPLIESVPESNTKHVEKAADLISEYTPPGERILIVGVAFKPGTDDCRESPYVYLAKKLLEKGYSIKFYDPFVRAEQIDKSFGEGFISVDDGDFYENLEEALDQNRYVVLSGSYNSIRLDSLKGKTVFDLNGVLYGKNAVRGICEYHGLCW